MLNDLIEFFSEYKQIDKSEINSNSRLVLDLGLGSFDLIQVCYLLEQKFNIEISDSVLLNFQTVGDINEYITNCTVSK